MIICRESATVLRDQGVSQLLVDSQRELLADGFVFTEGPLELADGSLIFQDLKSDRTWRWSDQAGLSLLRENTNAGNGQTWGPDGRIWLCEQNGRRVSSMNPDGSNVRIEIETWHGARLNSPNDIIMRRDGLILFTDPPYGVEPQHRSLHFQGVYAFRPGWPEPKLLADDFERPNGLALSPDEKTLYVCDTFRYHLRAFDISPNGEIRPGSSRIFAKFDTEGPGGPDGMKVDLTGRLYIAVLGGIWVYEPDGRFLGIIATPKRPSNLAWCGPDGACLCVTAVDQVFRFRLNVCGIKPHQA
jgi:gluconolactonase